VSRKRKIDDVEVVTIDDNNDKMKRVDNADERAKKKQKKDAQKVKKKNAISHSNDLNTQLEKILSTYNSTKVVDKSEDDRMKVMGELDDLLREFDERYEKQKIDKASKRKKNTNSKSSKKTLTIKQSSKGNLSNSSSAVGNNNSSTSSVSIISSRKNLTVVKKVKISSNVSESQDQTPVLSIALDRNENFRLVSGGGDSEVLSQFKVD
jgi:hypothetical protein